MMDLDRWLQIGIDNRWVAPVCLTHDWVEQTAEELEGFDMGDDPCVPRWIVNHPPTP